MAKELYLYSPIYDFVAEDLITKMEENKSADIVIRANTPGGSVFSGWGIIAKMKEHVGKVKMKVDGSVASMGTFVLCFADESEALDISKIHLHRADMYVNGPEDQAFLDGVNKDLKAKLVQKIDAAKLKELKGVSVEDLFDPTKRVELWLTAKEAKAIGLIDRIVKLNPTEIAAFNEYFQIAATTTPPSQPNNSAMTLEELKAKHPELFAQIMALGVNQERDRVGAWMAFVNIDAAEVAKGIKAGENLSQTALAEFTVKGISAQALKNATASNAPVVTTTEPEAPKTEKEKEIAAAEANMRKMVGLK